MSAQHILLIEDEPQIRRFVRTALMAEGYQIHEAETAKRGLIDAATRRPDLIILDLGLPDEDGLQVIRDLRTWCSLPIIVLSARSDETDKISALDHGADDYLTKPFGVGELIARVKAHLRRHQSGQQEASTLQMGDITIDLISRTVHKANQLKHLTPLEYRLLTVLIKHQGRVLTHAQLLNEVWGAGHAGQEHYVRVFMANLRQKLEDNPANPRHLLTEIGVGYRLVI